MVAGLAMLFVCTAQAETGTVSGVVRSPDGKAVAGATISLACAQPTSNSLQTITDKNGEYHFDGLLPCEYSVKASFTGYMPADSKVAKITDAAYRAYVDFTLVPIRAEATSLDPSQDKPPLKFEAAGVRGLIDSGGYSVSATATSATGLIKGMADLKRTDSNAELAAEKIPPCTLEPELKKALETNPDQAEANRQLGLFYVAHGEPAKGVPYLERARQVSNSDFETSHDLAVALLKSGQFASAQRLLTTLLAQHPTSDLHQLLALAEEGVGEFKAASRRYQIAAQQEPTEENLFGVGYELILAGLPKEAASAFEDGMKRLPNSILLRIGLGSAEFLQGRTAEGITVFLEGTDLKPSDSRPYVFLANAAGSWGDQTARVLACFKRFWTLNPADAEANYYYALGLMDPRAKSIASDGRKAEDLLQRAVELNPKLSPAHFQLAGVYAERGDTQAAIREYEVTVQLAPDKKEAHYRLGRLYKQVGRNDESTKEMDLFAQAGDRQTASRVSVEQFVSVIDPPRPQGVQRLSCPQP